MFKQNAFVLHQHCRHRFQGGFKVGLGLVRGRLVWVCIAGLVGLAFGVLVRVGFPIRIAIANTVLERMLRSQKYIKGEITRKDLEKRMLEKTLEHEYAKPYSGEPFEINEYEW